MCERLIATKTTESRYKRFVDGVRISSVHGELQNEFRHDIGRTIEKRVDKLRAGEPDADGQIAMFRAELVPEKPAWHCTQHAEQPDVSMCAADPKRCELSRKERHVEYRRSGPRSSKVYEPSTYFSMRSIAFSTSSLSLSPQPGRALDAAGCVFELDDGGRREPGASLAAT